MKHFSLILFLFSVALHHSVKGVDSIYTSRNPLLEQSEDVQRIRFLKGKSGENIGSAIESNKSIKAAKSGKANTSIKAAKSGKANTSIKAPKSAKAIKAPKSAKANKLVKAPKSGKANKLVKAPKSGKAGKSTKAPKSCKSEKSGKSGKSGKSCKSSKSRKFLTNSPTVAPSEESILPCLTQSVREANIKSVVSTISSSISPDSPAEKALDWLINTDIDTNACDGIHDIIERYVLALFYFSTNGNSWKQSTNWLGSIEQCSWYGIICTDGPVNGILLNNNNLGGVLPKELSFLTSFNTLRVYQNNIQGEIPFEIYSLPLTYLDLESNQFSGEPFPPDIARALFSLQRLRISQNPFSSYSLPPYIGNMTQLEQLWIVNTNAVGTIPSEINHLTSLEQILARDNDLIGQIPDMGRLINLDRILLQNNRLESTIPSSLGSLKNLKILKLSNNNLTGSIPSSFSRFENMEELEIANNTLIGTLPDLSSLVSLRIIDLSNNTFVGPIPDFASSQQLNYTSLSHNFFSGVIPPSFFELPVLKYLYLNNNDLFGNIPENFGNSKSLIDLYLNNNRLTGYIPDIDSGDLPMIEELLINSNTLVGPVPDSLCDGRTWISLHADCHPEEGSDVPRNICPDECCTTCFPIKVASSYYQFDGKEQMPSISDAIISSQPTVSYPPSDDTKTSFFDKLKAWFMRIISVEEWTIKEWVVFFIGIFAGVSILVCLFNCFCCRDGKQKKRLERMREKKRLQREKLREKHLEEYCDSIREKMREKNEEVERELKIWAAGEKIANRRDLVDVPL